MNFDCIVVGVGSMGSAAAFYLARQGHRVLAIDQFDPPHSFGSHAGQSRIIRKAYFEHPDYVPLLERSYVLWKELEMVTGQQFYHQTGIVYFGKEQHPTMVGVRKSAELYNLHVGVSTASENKYPAFNIPAHFQMLIEHEAGFVRPELAIEQFIQQAKLAGAVVHTNEKILEWKADQRGVSVKTATATYHAEKLIITAGSWAKNLVPSLSATLKVTRQTLAWINPLSPEDFSLGEFPCWFIEDDDLGMYYGFPILPFEKFGGPIGLKIASHRPGPLTEPDRVPETIFPDDLANIRRILRKYFRGAGEEIIALKKCLYTYSPDENFIIDLLPGTHSRVVVAAGFSGHGFKFVPVVGEILAALSISGKTDMPIEFLKIDRF